jgi:hypothetical protein
MTMQIKFSYFLFFLLTIFLGCSRHEDKKIEKEKKLITGTNYISNNLTSNVIKSSDQITNNLQVSSKTKKILLADQYLKVNSGVDVLETRKLLSEIIQAEGNFWQKDMARMLLIGSYSAKDGIDVKIKAIEEALTQINFEELEKNNDPEFLNYYAMHGLKPEKIREKLLLVLGDAYCQKGDINKAQLVLDSIKDEELKSMLEQSLSEIRKSKK